MVNTSHNLHLAFIKMQYSLFSGSSNHTLQMLNNSTSSLDYNNTVTDYTSVALLLTGIIVSRYGEMWQLCKTTIDCLYGCRLTVCTAVV